MHTPSHYWTKNNWIWKRICTKHEWLRPRQSPHPFKLSFQGLLSASAEQAGQAQTTTCNSEPCPWHKCFISFVSFHSLVMYQRLILSQDPKWAWFCLTDVNTGLPGDRTAYFWGQSFWNWACPVPLVSLRKWHFQQTATAQHSLTKKKVLNYFHCNKENFNQKV